MFARSAELVFNFTDAQHYSNVAVKESIRAIPNRLFYQTRTDRALILANEQMFGDISLGDRPDRPNYLFVLTDGRPYPPEDIAPFNETIPPLEVGSFTSH